LHHQGSDAVNPKLACVGKQFPTVGAGKGKVAFDNYTIDAARDLWLQ
jgi:hypothetical protein